MPNSRAATPVHRVVQVATTREELAAQRASLTGSVAVVMTMGALHEGHLTLVRRARELADHVVVTIFVNPLQFGPAEDFGRYPRTLAADLDALAGTGADLVFAPSVDVVYPGGTPQVSVSAGRIGSILEGAVRPGHFDGVLTVVLKLLHMVRPDVAVFGDKDAQQLVAVRTMVRDLDAPVKIVGVPTVRELDGLALSSRNRYLDTDERAAALALPAALAAAGKAAANGQGTAAVVAAAHNVLQAANVTEVNYVVGVEPETIEEVSDDYVGPLLVLIAARIGTTRLIDNAIVVVGSEGSAARE